MSFSEGADPVVAKVKSALSRVEDPELGPDIGSLGLISAVDGARFLLGVYG